MPEQTNSPLGQSGGRSLTGATQPLSSMDDNVAGSRSSRNRGDTGTDATDAARRAISTVASEAGSKVASGLDSQKSKAAEGLGSVAQALRQTSDDLRDKDQGPIHQYVASAADQVERFSGYLRSKSVSEMVGEVEQFARRQPALFLGSAFLLGLVGARFLKSSSAGTRDYGGMQGRDTGFSGSRDDYTGMQGSRSYSAPAGGSLAQDRYSSTGTDTSSTGALARGTSDYRAPGTSTSTRDPGGI